MKWFVLAFAALLFLGVIGCDGGGDGDATTAAGSGDTGGATEGDGTTDFVATVIAEGTQTFPSDSGVQPIASFVTPTAGHTNGMISWSGPPDELWISFRVEDIGPPAGRVHGGSPQASEISVEAGKEVIFNIWNTTGMDVNVHYQLVFIPE